MLSCVPASYKSVRTELSKQKGVDNSADGIETERDLSLFGYSVEKISRKCFCG